VVYLGAANDGQALGIYVNSYAMLMYDMVIMAFVAYSYWLKYIFKTGTSAGPDSETDSGDLVAEITFQDNLPKFLGCFFGDGYHLATQC